MKDEIVGFTGTREHLTHWQISRLQDIFSTHAPAEIHHGDCRGADAMVHALASTAVGVRIVVHPPADGKQRAYCKGDNVIVLEPRPFLERNHAIVDSCDIVIALPKTDDEQLRSGTWATARYAVTVGKRLMLIQPGGVSRWVDNLEDLARNPFTGRRRR